MGVGAATVVVATSSLDADLDRALETAVLAQVAALDGELPDGEEQQEVGEHSPAVADTVLLVLDADGRVLLNRTGQTLPGLPDADALKGAADGLDIRTVEPDRTEVRVLTMLVTHDGVPAGFIQGGFDLTLHDQQARSLVLAVLVVGALGLVAAAAIAYVVTGRALVPIRQGFEAQRRFVADASHELRTPAALIRANAEVLERERLVADDGRELLDDVIAEADRLGGLVGDLLQLAGWDATSLTIAPEPLDVAAVARDTVRGATALAAERGVRLVVDAPGPAPASADRDRLVQLLLVLIDNAIDHSPAGGQVSVGVRRHGHEILARGGRPGARHPGIGPGADLRALHPAAGHHAPWLGRHGPRPLDRAPDRRGARRVDLGGSAARRRSAVHGGAPRRRDGWADARPVRELTGPGSPAPTPGRSGPRCRRPRPRGRGRAGRR